MRQIPKELPSGDWPVDLRSQVAEAASVAGKSAIKNGDFDKLAKLYADFAELFPRLMVDQHDVDPCARVYDVMYFMLWRYTQNLSNLLKFNRDVAGPFSQFVSRVFRREELRPFSKPVPRVAYLTRTGTTEGSGAVGRITLSLVLGHQMVRQRADWPVVYLISKPKPDLLSFVERHEIAVRLVVQDGASASAEAIVKQAREDEIDILVSDTSCAIATIAFQRRAARLQCFHENGFAPWNISELDAIFFGVTKQNVDVCGTHTRQFRTPRNTAFVFQKVERSPELVSEFSAMLRDQSGVSEPTTIFGFYGRMPKITKEYMALIDAILARLPGAIFFAGGTGFAAPVFEAKAKSAHGDRMVILNEYVDGHVVSCAIDVFLDTFPFPGGLSCVEAQANGVPVVWMGRGFEAEFEIVAQQRDSDLNAGDGETFINLALSLDSREERNRRAAVAVSIARKFGDMRGQALQVDRHLQELWSECGGAR